MSDSVRTTMGVPTIKDFKSIDGTPIVIDVLTRIAYFLYENQVFPLAPNPSSMGAFSSGFSTGFV